MKTKLVLPLLALALLALRPSLRAAADTQVIAAGKTVTLTVVVTGFPAPAIEWFKDGAKVGEGETLALGVLTPAMAGSYTVTATNAVGSATSDPTVIVVGTPPAKPVIKVEVKVEVVVTP